jgi:hypothetical protein
MKRKNAARNYAHHQFLSFKYCIIDIGSLMVCDLIWFLSNEFCVFYPRAVCQCQRFNALTKSFCQCQGLITLTILFSLCQRFNALAISFCQCKRFNALTISFCQCQRFNALTISFCQCQRFNALTIPFLSMSMHQCIDDFIYSVSTR